VLAFGASDGSFLRNPVTTLASSTGGCRAPPCHIVGRVLRTHSASGPVPVSLATCTPLTGYLIEYILPMRFLAHHWDGHGRGDCPSPPNPDTYSRGWGRNGWRCPPGVVAPARARCAGVGCGVPLGGGRWRARRRRNAASS